MKTDRTMYQSTIRVLLATAFLLSIPLVAKLFTDEMAWTLSDFIFMGALVAGTGFMYELATRVSGNIAYRAAFGLALAGVFLLVWLNLAVGLIGSEDNSANAMYLGVLAVAFLGAILARLQPRGMARAMWTTAFALALVAVVALIFGLGGAASGPVEILGVNGMFIVLFAGSALLFRQAAGGAPERRAA